jgi:hypothetical protein
MYKIMAMLCSVNIFVCLIVFVNIVDNVHAVPSIEFYNSNCIKHASSKKVKVINAVHWKQSAACYAHFINTTQQQYLEQLYQYGTTKPFVTGGNVSLRMHNAHNASSSSFPSKVIKYIPTTRGTCVSHNYENITLNIHAIYGFSSFIECSKIACNEKQLCNLDEDLNIVDEDSVETCLAMCADRYLRCTHFEQTFNQHYAFYGAAVGEDKFLGYSKPILLLVQYGANGSGLPSSGEKTFTFTPYGIITYHELALGILSSCFTLILFLCIIKFHFIDLLLRLIHTSCSQGIRKLKGRRKAESLLKGDTVNIWNTKKKQWNRGTVEKHIKKFQLYFKHQKQLCIQWINGDDVDPNDKQPIISSHDSSEWKTVNIGDVIEARPKGKWVKCTVKERKDFIIVRVAETNVTQKLMLPNQRVKTVERRQSTSNKLMSGMSQKLQKLSFMGSSKDKKKYKSSTQNDNVSQNRRKTKGHETKTNDTNTEVLRYKYVSNAALIANASLLFVGIVAIRLVSSILHILKLMFNVFLLLQVVALDHYSLTAYSYSINLSMFGAFKILKLPELNIYM